MHGLSLMVESNTTHVLLTKRTLLCRPLEGGCHVLLDLVHVLHSSGAVDNNVGTRCIRTPCPDLACSVLVPLKLLTVEASTLLGLCLGAGRSILNGLAELLIQRLCNNVDTIVLVWRFGQAGLRGSSTDGLTVGHNRVGHDEITLGILLPQIF